MRVLLISLVLAACGGRPSTALRWASQDLHCPEEAIDVVYVDLDTFEVVGCGHRVLYMCPTSKACERLGEPQWQEEREENADALASPPR